MQTVECGSMLVLTVLAGFFECLAMTSYLSGLLLSALIEIAHFADSA